MDFGSFMAGLAVFAFGAFLYKKLTAKKPPSSGTGGGGGGGEPPKERQ
jgi:hypothetical protein